MLLWMRYVVGLVFVGLIALDNLVASIFAALMIGAFGSLFWVASNIFQTHEYWYGKSPQWMTRLVGNPNKQGSSPRLNYYGLRFFALFGGIFMTYGLIVGSTNGNLHIVVAMLFPIVWIIGVLISECHFRQKYSLIKDWSEAKSVLTNIKQKNSI
ncbi:MAG: hypothetical protein GY861_23350 [bacterium]|nr:hypothetical protein [bacterium]